MTIQCTRSTPGNPFGRIVMAGGSVLILAILSGFAIASPGDEKDPKAKQSAPVLNGTSREASNTPANTDQKSEKQLAEERKAREAAKKRGELTFDDLKFDIEKDGKFFPEMITPEIKELEKKTFKLRGFILPVSVFTQTGIKQFVLVRDNKECCFGPGAALYDCVMVHMAPGKTATFSTRVVTVKGKLEVDAESYRNDDGSHYAIYKMTAEEVR